MKKKLLIISSMFFCVLFLSVAGIRAKQIERNKIYSKGIDTIKKTQRVKKKDMERSKEEREDRQIYFDDVGNEYIFRGDTCTGFLNKEIVCSSEKKEYTEEEIIEISEKYLSELSNGIAYSYVENTYKEETGNYSVRYSYYKDYLLTDDTIIIDINKYGELVSYVCPNQGKYLDYNNAMPTKMEIEEEIDSEVKKYYGNDATYSIHLYYISMYEGEICIKTSVEIEYEVNKEKYSEYKEIILMGLF